MALKRAEVVDDGMMMMMNTSAAAADYFLGDWWWLELLGAGLKPFPENGDAEEEKSCWLWLMSPKSKEPEGITGMGCWLLP